MSNLLPPKGIRRRDFITTAAVAGTGLLMGCTVARPRPISPNSKLNIGVVGVMGKGQSDTDMCATENIAALCDVDEKGCASQRAKYPNAKFYQDFREMLEKEKTLDAVIVATPDHLHAAIASMAIQMGKHVYCQKPLTQTVAEARHLRALAKKHKVITQMGNQGSAEDGLRRAVECVQAGLIGQVSEVHVWSNRPIWPQGMDRPVGEDPIPDGLKWDLWLGPASYRPYKRGSYTPFNWRGWQDFGTGALGDMACHTANMPFRALKLGYPTSIEAVTSAMNRESYPLKSKIRFQFPARDNLIPVSLTWYDGGEPAREPNRHDGTNKPAREITAVVEEMTGTVPRSGCLLMGDKGRLFSPDDYGTRFFLRLKDEPTMTDGRNHEAVKAIPQVIPRNEFQAPAGFRGDTGDLRHHLEWINACKSGRPAYSDFEIAAYLTEIILLGCVAMRVGRKLEWDGPNMRSPNAPEAAAFINREYRTGWKM
jgi:predicted dehydrogenase